MISREQALYVTQNLKTCTKLFGLHRWHQQELLLLDKIRTRRARWQRVLRSQYPEKSPQKISPTPLKSYSKSIKPISTIPRQAMVICHRGQDKVVFSGTLFRVANQVVLFLTTGMNGDILRKKSSSDLMRMVASSSYASAMSRLRSATKSTSPETESYVRATHPHEEYARRRHPLPEVEFIRQSTQSSVNSKENL